MDTGIGPDSYSIIELKMVDELLNDRNNTIRQLLEEAAGITKYKLRKRQTMARLDETDADLNRVNDLLAEIEKSMKQLESQARRVDRFNRLKEKYKAVGLQAGLRSLAAWRESLDRLDARERLLRDDKIELNAKTAALEAALEKIKLDSLEKEKTLAASQKQLNDRLLVIAQLENELRSGDEKAGFLREKQASLNGQIESDARQVTEWEDAVEAMQADKLAEQARHDLAAGQLETLKEDARRQRAAWEGRSMQCMKPKRPPWAKNWHGWKHRPPTMRCA
jgi:chromosome segregation protein